MGQTPPDFAKVGDQAKFLHSSKESAPITYLFQYEDQSGLKQFFEQRLEIKFNLQKRNVSPKKPYPSPRNRRKTVQKMPASI